MTQAEAMTILKMGYNVFLTGAPGSGKTFLLNKYIEYLRKGGKRVAVTASTGIAATHMNGKTLHSWSGIGIKDTITDGEIRSLLKKPYLRKAIKKTDVLIIDEISMLKPGQFEAVDRICQYFRASFLPFGGMQVVCSGDFFQLPPIQRNGEELKFVVSASSWKNMDMKICYLEEQFRQKDQTLSDLLKHIRQNNPEASKQMLLSHARGNAQLPVSTKLYTHNVDVDQINNEELAKIDGKEYKFYMTFSGKQEIVESLKKSCLAPEMLTLKVGAQVMFIKNNFEAGYVNGTQGTVTAFDEEGMPVVETLDGIKITARQAGWAIEEDEKTLAQIKQIPLRLAWAITVHKSQGMNLDSAQIDLSKCFIEGMGYVAISRLSSLKGLSLMGINDMAFCVHQAALDIDQDFKQNSAAACAFLAKMPAADVARRQTRFLEMLPRV